MFFLRIVSFATFRPTSWTISYFTKSSLRTRTISIRTVGSHFFFLWNFSFVFLSSAAWTIAIITTWSAPTFREIFNFVKYRLLSVFRLGHFRWAAVATSITTFRSTSRFSRFLTIAFVCFRWCHSTAMLSIFSISASASTSRTALGPASTAWHISNRFY